MLNRNEIDVAERKYPGVVFNIKGFSSDILQPSQAMQVQNSLVAKRIFFNFEG